MPPTADFERPPDLQQGEDQDQDAAVDASRLPRGLPSIPNYELLGLLGRGGMGMVLKARHQVLHRLVAIKIPLGKRVSRRKRFLREARSAARLRHPNICAIHEVGEVEDRPYIVMDLIRGKRLRDWARTQRPNARRIAEIVAALSRAVGYAHQHGVIHRDLKPSNVMLDAETGEPVLMDFGLAKEITLEGSSQLTRSGQIMGTPAYMAPEQAAGQQERIGPRSDVYALGAILYELLCGEPPFVGSAGEVLWKVQSDEPVPLRKHAAKVHRDLETICLKAMAKDPADRYATATELAQDIERFNAGEAILARRRSVTARLWRAVAKRPVLSGLLAAAVVAMVASGYLVTRGQQEREVAGLLTSLEADFDANDWSAQRLDDIDATLSRLERRAPDQAAIARVRLVQRLAAFIEEQLKSATLPPQSLTRIETALGLLAERDARKAARLRAALQSRLRVWEEVFDLAAPFSHLQAVFDPGVVKTDGKRLVRATGEKAAETAVLCTRVASHGAVHLEAVFDASWENADELGLLVCAAQRRPTSPDTAAGSPEGGKPNSGDNRGYRFLVRTPRQQRLPSGESRAIEPRSFAEVRQSGGLFILEISRGRSRFRKVEIAGADLPAGPLRLRVTKEEDQLGLEVGNLPSLDFSDPFAYRGAASGVFAVGWPGGVGISQLRAERRTLPERPSPLQRGDNLYAEGNFAEAFWAYREQAQSAVQVEVETEEQGETEQQARYKQAVCLLALKRQPEAEVILERVAGEQGGRWPALAACQVWLLRVQQKRFDQTDDIFQSLATRYRLEQIASMVPSELHAAIVFGYSRQSLHLNVYGPNPNLVRQCERAVAIAEFFGSGADTLGWANQGLVRAYRATGREEQALQIQTEVLRRARTRDLGASLATHVDEYCWLLRLAGRSQEALAELDYWCRKAGSHPHHRFVLERARVLAALGRFDDAEKTLDGLFAAYSAKEMGADYVIACALRGFLRLRRGDEAGAQESWKQGIEPRWAKGWSGFHVLHSLVVASLSGEFSESDAEALLKRIVSNVGSDSVLGLSESPLGQYMARPQVVASVLRGVFRSPRGRECARKIVFREIPFAECARLPPMLVASELFRQRAMPENITDEQDALIWKLVEDGYSGVLQTGSISKTQVIQLLFAWKGMTNFLGWSGVAPTLQPELRGPAAYVLGQRYLRLKRPKDAAMFFQAALADAPAGSSLAALARAELQRLAPKN